MLVLVLDPPSFLFRERGFVYGKMPSGRIGILRLAKQNVVQFLGELVRAGKIVQIEDVVDAETDQRRHERIARLTAAGNGDDPGAVPMDANNPDALENGVVVRAADIQKKNLDIKRRKLLAKREECLTIEVPHFRRNHGIPDPGKHRAGSLRTDEAYQAEHLERK